MNELRFDGKVAIVTGAGGSANLGRAHARLLAARGAKVVVNDLGVGPNGRSTHPADARSVAAEIVAAGGEAIADLHSVAEEESAVAIVQAALNEWGRIDILINNAGVGLHARFPEATSRDIRRAIDVHLMGSIWMCRAAWPHMVKAGYGRIVNTVSAAMFGMQATTVYGAAKFGIYGLTRGLAAEGLASDIKVNALSPGAATNSMGHGLTFKDPAMTRMFFERFPPELVAAAAVYLVHETCAVTGSMIHAGGGEVSARFVGATAGFCKEGLVPEDVRDNLNAVFDVKQMTVVTDPYSPTGAGNNPIADLMVATPYVPG